MAATTRGRRTVPGGQVVPVRVTAEQVLRYRASVTHLDGKLPGVSGQTLAEAAWGGLQDSMPRGGVVSLHARIDGVRPDTWEDPSLVQIWFRGGADYLVPRADVGIFTLGSYPRDPALARALEGLATEVHRLAGGKMTLARELPRDLGGRPWQLRSAAVTGRLHIRWDAANTWVIPVERPAIDAEDARRELARRFLHWLGPRTMADLARWTGADPRDARATWQAIDAELVPVEIDGVGERRFALAADVAAIVAAAPVEGARLLPQDDPYTKRDHELLVPDERLRFGTLPKVGASPGYIPGPVMLDGEVVGGWQR